MQQKNPAANFFDDAQSAMKQFMDAVPTANPFDFKTVLEAQRKNIQAMAEANQCVMTGWQNLAKRQTEMVSKFVQENSGKAAKGFSAAAPQETLTKQAEILKSACEQTLQNAREITEIMRESAVETADVINRRFTAGINEIQASATKKTAK